MIVPHVIAHIIHALLVGIPDTIGSSLDFAVNNCSSFDFIYNPLKRNVNDSVHISRYHTSFQILDVANQCNTPDAATDIGFLFSFSKEKYWILILSESFNSIVLTCVSGTYFLPPSCRHFV
jgi:hypothetical protein